MPFYIHALILHILCGTSIPCQIQPWIMKVPFTLRTRILLELFKFRWIHGTFRFAEGLASPFRWWPLRSNPGWKYYFLFFNIGLAHWNSILPLRIQIFGVFFPFLPPPMEFIAGTFEGRNGNHPPVYIAVPASAHSCDDLKLVYVLGGC